MPYSSSSHNGHAVDDDGTNDDDDDGNNNDVEETTWQPRRRPRRTAAARRQQQQRSHIRAKTKMIAGLQDLSTHRGCHLSQLGQALLHALQQQRTQHHDDEQHSTSSNDDTRQRQKGRQEQQRTAHEHRRTTTQRYRNTDMMPMCRHFFRGTCTSGDECKFAHTLTTQMYEQQHTSYEPDERYQTQQQEYGEDRSTDKQEHNDVEPNYDHDQEYNEHYYNHNNYSTPSEGASCSSRNTTPVLQQSNNYYDIQLATASSNEEHRYDGTQARERTYLEVGGEIRDDSDDNNKDVNRTVQKLYQEWSKGRRTTDALDTTHEQKTESDDRCKQKDDRCHLHEIPTATSRSSRTSIDYRKEYNQMDRPLHPEQREQVSTTASCTTRWDRPFHPEHREGPSTTASSTTKPTDRYIQNDTEEHRLPHRVQPDGPTASRSDHQQQPQAEEMRIGDNDDDDAKSSKVLISLNKHVKTTHSAHDTTTHGAPSTIQTLKSIMRNNTMTRLKDDHDKYKDETRCRMMATKTIQKTNNTQFKGVTQQDATQHSTQTSAQASTIANNASRHKQGQATQAAMTHERVEAPHTNADPRNTAPCKFLQRSREAAQSKAIQCNKTTDTTDRQNMTHVHTDHYDVHHARPTMEQIPIEHNDDVTDIIQVLSLLEGNEQDEALRSLPHHLRTEVTTRLTQWHQSLAEQQSKQHEMLQQTATLTLQLLRKNNLNKKMARRHSCGIAVREAIRMRREQLRNTR